MGENALFLSDGVTLDYADNAHSIIHGVERIGDDEVCWK